MPLPKDDNPDSFFYCEIDEAQRPAIRYNLIKDKALSELPVKVTGSRAKLETRWLMKCKDCGRNYSVSVYLE